MREEWCNFNYTFFSQIVFWKSTYLNSKITTMGERSVKSCFVFMGGMFEATQGPDQKSETENTDLPIGRIRLFTCRRLETKSRALLVVILLSMGHYEDRAAGLKSSFHTFYKAGENRPTAPRISQSTTFWVRP